MITKIINYFKNFRIGESPWDYYFLKNLDESEYPKYLAKLFYINTGEKLPLKFDFKNKSWIIDKKKCKTFNQKIQWLKLYDATDLKRKCTDKVLVRDYAAEKIGSEYLKPVLKVIPSLNCDCHVIARNNSLEGDEAIRGKRSQKAVHENWEIKSNNQPDCHGSQNDIEPRNDGKIDTLHPKFNDMTTYLLNKKDTSAQNSCLPQYDETITDFNTLSHSEPNVNSGVKNLYTSSRVDFSQPKQDVTTYFDQIDWENLPNSFVIKCNHGCKWQFIIKNKEEYLSTNEFVEITKRRMTGWLEQNFCFWGGFELNYLNIEPKILIEPLLRTEINKKSETINIYCFNGVPQIIIKFHNENKVSIWNKKFNSLENIFGFAEENIKIAIDKYIKQSIDLSKELSKDFIFVRVDWMIYQNKLYFEELTFSPYSGFIKFDKKSNLKMGMQLNWR